MTDTKYWLVYSPTGPTPPRFRHDNQHFAVIEAQRMARLHPGQEFFVLEAVDGYCYGGMAKVHWTDYPEEDLPCGCIGCESLPF